MNMIVIPSMYLLAGICAYAAFTHLTAGLRRPFDLIHLLFAGLCLTMLPFAIYSALAMQAETVSEFVHALKGNIAAIIIFFGLFSWFIILYTKKRHWMLVAGLNVLLALMFVVNLLQPYSLQFEQIDHLRTLQLPWGESVTRAAGRNGFWIYVGIVTVVLELVYALYALGSQFRRHRRMLDLGMMLAVIVFLLGSIEGSLTRLMAIDFVEAGPFGFLFMVIAMSILLNYETRQRLRDSEHSFRSLFENSPTGMIAIDPENLRIVRANRIAQGMFGYGAEEVLTKTILDITLPDDIAQSKQRFEQLSRGEEDHMHYEKRLLRMDGSSFLADISIATLKDSNGKVESFIGSAIDISERKQFEDSLKDSEVRFRSIIEQSPVAISFSRDGYSIDANPAYMEMFGFENIDEIIGKPVVNQIAPQSRAEVEDRIARRMRGESVESSYDVVGLRKDGSEFPLFVSAKRLILKDGPISSAFLIDFTERQKAKEQIERLAFYDHLTDLPNRQLLMDRLQQALALSARSGQQGALLLIDLDNFKSLNDTLGHDIGDMLLLQVADRLVSCVQEGDTVARLGGDEFVVMLENLGEHALESATQVELVCEKILAALEQPYRLAAHDFQCTSSIGITLFHGRNQEIDDLLKQADIAMYQAKRAGRNSLRFFDQQMQETISARTSLEMDLRKAIENRQFHLYYQIQVDNMRYPIGAEALIRWIHPERGVVSPDQFISLAEETGLILSIGQWVLETACAQLKAWQQNALTRSLVLAVNVSARQFHQDNFFNQVREAVQHHAIDPKLLKLELTEGMLLENINETIAIMGALNEMGIQISLDDFGTGYSSIQYLKRLPLHQLKIDQSFVRGLEIDGNDRTIVSTIITMSESFGIDIIAEGVETEQQKIILLQLGCSHFQGYLFSKALPIDEFNGLLSRGHSV